VIHSSVTASDVILEAIQVRSATFRDTQAAARMAVADELRRLPARERVLLDTCHRAELVSVGGESGDGSGVRGRAAVQRVFEVVAGFDSAVVAEEQLLGQVREAYETALADGETGPVLNELFRRALRFGRRVRSHAQPGTDRSLADPSLAWLLARIGAPARVVVAGTGVMGRMLALRISAAGHRVTILSRSAERGRALVESLHGDGHRLAVGPLTHAIVARTDAMALAVKSREPVLAETALGDARPWTLDLSAPSAVEPEAAAKLGHHLLTLDKLGASSDRRAVLSDGAQRRLRAELKREVEAFCRWLGARRGGEALAVLHGEADALRRRHLEQLRARAGLSDEQLAAVEAASAAMLGELLHGPSMELRRGGADAATVRRLFGIEA
jgi:glutamyl-tRNA reductase